MAFTLPDLPYAKDALEPHISARTLDYHHGKHHQKYVDTLNSLVGGTEFDSLSLEEIIQRSANSADHENLFNQAAQVWNHSFYWQCMSPDGGGQPDGGLFEKIEQEFGSFDDFKTAFTDAGKGEFGSGWVWLVQRGSQFAVISTTDAETPLVDGGDPLLTMDVWEHAYYLDYQNERVKYIQAFLDHLVNWDFVASNHRKYAQAA